jgi:CubicO group peptidase (beta-lactamase class C family)
MLHNRVRLALALILVILGPLVTSCTASGAPQASSTGKLGDHLTEFLKDPSLTDVRAVIVASHDRTVFERYAHGGPEDHHNVYSVTKSVASTLVGIAVDEGLLRLDQTLAELLPAYVGVMSPQVRATTLEQLLTMTGGFPVTYPPDPNSSLNPNALTPTSDWVALALQSASAAPGRFGYSDVGAYLVGAVLAHATGRSMLQYAREKLFGPLGIPTTPAAEPPADPTNTMAYDTAGFSWSVDPHGIHTASSGLALRPRDMLTFGSLFLHHGSWQGRQIVSDRWVRQATVEHAPGMDEIGRYGYLWWVGTADGSPAYMAEGHGGQLIEVVPDRELVVVVSTAIGDHPFDDASMFTHMVDLVVAPALA